MPVKVLISGTEYPHRPLKELLEVASAFSVRHLELWIPHNFTISELSRVESELGKKNLSAAVISTWTQMNLPGDTAGRQKLVLESIQAAKALGARFVNTYFGGNPERTPEQAVKYYCDSIAPCLEAAEKEGIVITLENEFEPTGRDITRRAEWVRNLVETVNSRSFKLNFDPCNFYFAGEEAYPYAYRLLKDHIAYVHLKDGMKFHPDLYDRPKDESFVWKDLSGEYICCDMGSGAIPYGRLFHDLQADGYDGYLGLEPHVPPGDLKNSFRESLKFIRHHLNSREEKQ